MIVYCLNYSLYVTIYNETVTKIMFYARMKMEPQALQNIILYEELRRKVQSET